MSAPSDPRHGTQPAAPSTQEIPVVPPGQTGRGGQAAGPDAPATGASRAGALPAPGQLPPQPLPPQQPVPPPEPPPAAPRPPAWPETLADDPAPATRPAPVADGVQPTGPVDFVPGLPGAGSTEPEPRRRLRRPAGVTGAVPDPSALAGVGLAALAVVLLQLGLAQDGGGLWSAVTLWAAFATAATVLGLVALGARAAAPARVPAGTATRVAAASVLGLAVFWVLVVLPIVASDPGFLVTAALLALGGALWVGPARER